MAPAEQLEQIVQRAVNEAMDARLPDLRQEISRRVLEQLRSARLPSEHASVPDVAAAVDGVQNATTQTDILNALLAGAAKFAGRVALLVVRGGAAIGWQARGFEEKVIRALHLGLDHGTIARVIGERTVVNGSAREFDPAFASALSVRPEQRTLTVPLVVKDKVAALLYADAGREDHGPLDRPALELLTRSAALWLEVLTVRKLAATPAVPERSAAEPMIGPTEKVAESVSALTGTPAPPPLPAVPVAEAAPMEPASAPLPATEPAAAIPPQDQEVHKKALRFAKLLVDEIKLYNEAKVAEGRKRRDLYDRLKDDIEKSRATYDKRYGQTAAGGADYFNRELVRILANNDFSLLGGNFPG